jgi:hypothetical protein
MTEQTPTYSFKCPECQNFWTIDKFIVAAANLFSGAWDGVGVCPFCKAKFSWVRPGAMQSKKWYDGKKHYKPGRCVGCGKAIDGRRKHCNVACRQKAYRQRKKVAALRPGA